MGDFVFIGDCRAAAEAELGPPALPLARSASIRPNWACLPEAARTRVDSVCEASEVGVPLAPSSPNWSGGIEGAHWMPASPGAAPVDVGVCTISTQSRGKTPRAGGRFEPGATESRFSPSDQPSSYEA